MPGFAPGSVPARAFCCTVTGCMLRKAAACLRLNVRIAIIRSGNSLNERRPSALKFKGRPRPRPGAINAWAPFQLRSRRNTARSERNDGTTHSDRAGSAFAEIRAARVHAWRCGLTRRSRCGIRRRPKAATGSHEPWHCSTCAPTQLAHGQIANATVRNCSCPVDGALTQDRTKLMRVSGAAPGPAPRGFLATSTGYVPRYRAHSVAQENRGRPPETPPQEGGFPGFGRLHLVLRPSGHTEAW